MDSYVHDVLTKLSVFPLILPDKTVIEGNLLKRHITCRECYKNAGLCPKAAPLSEPKNCDKGFKVYPARISSTEIVVFGIITETSKHYLPPKLKSKLLSQAIPDHEIPKWVDNINYFLNGIEVRVSEKSKEYAEAFHDVNPSIGLLYRNAEAVISKYKGSNFNERFDSAPEEIKTLYKSGQLLHMRLNLMSLFSNPDLAKYGPKNSMPVYKVADKLTKLFYSEAHKAQIRIKLNGKSFNTPSAYQSLENILFILIENAIKYSIPGQDIDVAVQDGLGGAVEVSVESYGPVVPLNDVERMFEKRWRYNPAGLEKKTGSGLGLYLAKIIADAHGFQINYTGTPTTNVNEVPVGFNKFSFTVS